MPHIEAVRQVRLGIWCDLLENAGGRLEAATSVKSRNKICSFVALDDLGPRAGADVVEGGNSAPAVKIAPGACGVWFYLQSRPSFCGTSRHSQARESFLEFDIARRRTGLAGHTILPHRFCVL